MKGVGVDDRWHGQHGIGRYSGEVLPRLGVDWHPLGLAGGAGRPLASLLSIPRASESDFLYSPGFNGITSRLRQVLTLHDLIHLAPPARLPHTAYYRLVIRPIVRRAGTVITVSETSRRAIVEWLDDDSTTVINAGVGLSPAFTASGERMIAPRPYVLCVSSLAPHKNFGVVIDAMRLLPECDLVVVTPDAAAATTAASVAGLASRVTVHSGLDDTTLAALYRGAAATVLPSRLEGFGLPALESLACGTPVVHWAGCESVAEIVGSAGTAVEVLNDGSAWAAALSGYLGVAHPAAALIDTGAYSWDRTAAIVTETLRNFRY